MLVRFAIVDLIVRGDMFLTNFTSEDFNTGNDREHFQFLSLLQIKGAWILDIIQSFVIVGADIEWCQLGINKKKETFILNQNYLEMNQSNKHPS